MLMNDMIKTFIILHLVIVYCNCQIADEKRNITELIESRRFMSEEHTITTDDEYVLRIYRIVNPFYAAVKHTLRPVLLQHGRGSSGATFLINSEGELLDDGTYVENGGEIINRCIINGNETTGRTLGFVLSACGYDVWLGNSRGNSYSEKHLSLDTSDFRFWKFSFGTMGKYDIPAVVNYILNVTGQKTLAYIAHSQGTSNMFAQISTNPEFGNKIKPFIAMSPGVIVNHFLPEFVKVIISVGEPIIRNTIITPIGNKPPFAAKPNEQSTSNPFHNESLISLTGLDFGYGLPFSSDDPQINKSRSNLYTIQDDRSSTWCLYHFAQLLYKNTFINFDYDPIRNLKEYGSISPPEYKLENIISPYIAIFYSDNDLIKIEDIKILKSRLRVPLLDDYLVPYKGWSHTHYNYAMDTSKYINPRILMLLKSTE